MKTNTTIFDRYFHEKFWGNKDGSSGPNSAFDETPRLRENLAKLFQDLEVTSIYDAGCGDANLFKFIEIDGIDYLGAECVPALTEQNQVNFADKSNMQFVTADVVSEPIPKVDLILCRDVVHYLPNDLVWAFLENCATSESTYLLVTHNIHSQDSANSETETGIFRPINLTQNPFSLTDPMLTIPEDVFAKEMACWRLGDICDLIN